jgi:hypothetical protein
LCPEEKEGKKEHTIQEREKLLVIRNFTDWVLTFQGEDFVLSLFIFKTLMSFGS